MPHRLSPLPPLWDSSIAFERIDPARNCYRSYRVHLTKDLFGNWVLIRRWGRIGKPQRESHEYFPFRFDARERAQQVVRRRIRRGYHATAVY